MNRDSLEALVEEYLINHEGDPTSWTTERIVDLVESALRDQIAAEIDAGRDAHKGGVLMNACPICAHPSGFHGASCYDYTQSKITRAPGREAFDAWLNSRKDAS